MLSVLEVSSSGTDRQKTVEFWLCARWSPGEPDYLSRREWRQYQTGRQLALAAFRQELGPDARIVDWAKDAKRPARPGRFLGRFIPKLVRVACHPEGGICPADERG
jgi:hypothetical protein